MAPEGVPGYLRIRVVDRSPLFYFNDGFEQPTPSGVVVNLFNSIGTDATGTLTRWDQVSGSWSIASNVVTAPTTGLMTAGHPDWTDMTFTVRVKFTSSSSAPMIVVHCDGTDSNWIGARLTGANLLIDKVVGGVFTNGIVSVAAALTNGNQYWLKLSATGTAISATVYNDSAGAIGSQIATTSTTISDAGIQSGSVGLRNTGTVSTTYGGAFTTVCTVTGWAPDGAQGQAWTPVVTTGEPAFAQSKVSPPAGTYSASIRLATNGDAGSWQQTIRLFSATNATLTAQVKTSAGTANVSCGGLTTGNAGASFAAVMATGAMTGLSRATGTGTFPTVSCNLSGNAGTAYFDSLSITNPAYEITTDLPHLHRVHIDVAAMQPGNPGSSALGSFTVDLHPPGTEKYAAALSVYNQLAPYQRVEMYISHDGMSLGKLYYAGIISALPRTFGDTSSFQITGMGDLQLLKRAPAFPGEIVPSGVLWSAVAMEAMSENEAGAADQFTTFTAPNYISTSAPSRTAGTWSASTDEGSPVVTCSTGTGAALISKMGGAANDSTQHLHYVEVRGRLAVANDGTNGGRTGLLLSASNANLQNGILGYVTVKVSGINYIVDATLEAYSGGAIAFSATSSSLLTVPFDLSGLIPLTLGLLVQQNNAKLIVNGSPTAFLATTFDPGLGVNCYPGIYFGTPASGSSATYLLSLLQQTRYTGEAWPSTAVFIHGVLGSSTHYPPPGSSAAITHLETITLAMTNESGYWRYTPQPYVVGTRTLGVIDLTASPGTDRSKSIFFKRDNGNLISLSMQPNADDVAARSFAVSQSGSGGNGIGAAHDVPSAFKYGPVADFTLVLNALDYNSQRRQINLILGRKITSGTISGAKTAVVLRDAQTADQFRELDTITVDDPLMGLNLQATAVLGYTFDEGQPEQTLTLDNFAASDQDVITIDRLRQAVFQVSRAYSNR